MTTLARSSGVRSPGRLRWASATAATEDPAAPDGRVGRIAKQPAMRLMLHVRFLAPAIALTAALMLAPPAAFSQTAREWVDAFWPTAKAAGIKRTVYDAALGNFTPDPDVLKRAATQAEFNMAIWDYMDQMVSD